MKRVNGSVCCESKYGSKPRGEGVEEIFVCASSRPLHRVATPYALQGKPADANKMEQNERHTLRTPSHTVVRKAARRDGLPQVSTQSKYLYGKGWERVKKACSDMASYLKPAAIGIICTTRLSATRSARSTRTFFATCPFSSMTSGLRHQWLRLAPLSGFLLSRMSPLFVRRTSEPRFEP